MLERPVALQTKFCSGGFQMIGQYLLVSYGINFTMYWSSISCAIRGKTAPQKDITNTHCCVLPAHYCFLAGHQTIGFLIIKTLISPVLLCLFVIGITASALHLIYTCYQSTTLRQTHINKLTAKNGDITTSTH